MRKATPRTGIGFSLRGENVQSILRLQHLAGFAEDISANVRTIRRYLSQPQIIGTRGKVSA
jgi:hypothetical protein